jgi:hypothetical protein
MAAKKNTTEEIDTSLADVLGEDEQQAAPADPHAEVVEQITANIERAKSLAEAENAEGLAELNKETNDLISSLPTRGRHGDTAWAKVKQGMRAELKAASQAQAASPLESKRTGKTDRPTAAMVLKAKAEAEAADYTKFDGVEDRVKAGAGVVVDGVRLHVKTSQTARQAAEMLLDAQRRIITKDGVPDLKSADPATLKARKDMYEQARTVLAAEGDADHAKSLVDKFSQSVRNQFSDVLVGYVRQLDDPSSADEVKELYGPVLAAHPELTPSEAVFTFYDIPRLSKRELMAENQRAKNAKLKELEAKAEEGDSEAAEKVEEIKTATVQERIAADIQSAERSLTAAVKAARELSDEDRAALKAKMMELVALAAQI